MSADTPAGESPPGKVFAIVAVGVFLAQLDLFIVNIAFPAIRAGFAGSAVSDVSWVLSAYAIVFAALLVPAGKLGDVLGRRTVFVTGITVFGVGSALCALAPSVSFLVAARVVQAAGAAAVTATSLGLVLPVTPPAKWAAVIGGWAAVGALGAAAGPPLGGVLTQAGWRWIFLVNVPIALVTAVVAARRLRQIRPPDRPPLPDALGTGLLIAAITLVALGLAKGADWRWDLRATGSLAAGVLVGAAFLLRSRRHPAPVLELSILRVRAFALGSASAALFFAAFSAMLLGNVLFLTGVWHYSSVTAGLALTPGPVTAAVVAPIASRFVRRFGPGVVGAVGAATFAAGTLWWIDQVGLRPEYLSAFLPGMLLGGIGVGLVLPAFTVAATTSLPLNRLATGIGAQSTFRQIGAAFGVAVFVAILGTPTAADVLERFDRTRLFMVLCAVVAALVLLPVRRSALNTPPGQAATRPAGHVAGTEHPEGGTR